MSAEPGVPWRDIVPDDADLERIAHLVACRARMSVIGTDEGPPVKYTPMGGRHWRFTVDAAELTPAEAIDVVDAWATANGRRAWCWEMVLDGGERG